MPLPTSGATVALSRGPLRLKWSAILFVGLLHVGASTALFHCSWRGFWTFALLHVGAVAALFHCSWRGFWTFALLQWLTGAIGICLGYHRFLTHRSFKAPKIVEYFLATLGCLANQGGPIAWVATHRLHHARSDQPDDPHSPVVEGLWWAHMGWALCDNALLDDFNVYRHFASDLARDRYLRFMDRTHWIWSWLLVIPLYALGGWSAVLWGIFFRSVFVYHCTWAVNSFAHRFGYRNFETGEGSRNLWWVALVAYGEGWHNNHHAYQRSARHGLKWWEFDVTYLTIRLMSRLGLATDIQMPVGKPAYLAPNLPLVPLPSVRLQAGLTV